jgi:carbonic anhydrase/acetyltransferase-like protein (isoleucine patch superfamily)
MNKEKIKLIHCMNKEKSKGIDSIGKNCQLLGDIDKHNRHLVKMGNNVILGIESLIVLHGPVRPHKKNNKVIIEDSVWIGRRALILCGVKIGKASIIGAMSLVCSDIPPYTVAAGNPCKPIRKIKPLELLLIFASNKERFIVTRKKRSKKYKKWSVLTIDDIKYLFSYKTNKCYDSELDLDNMTVNDVLDFYQIKR